MGESPTIVDKGRKPRLKAPPKACETHSHIYAPPEIYEPFPGRRATRTWDRS